MKRGRRGFTIIEVSLFLAITGLLFLGVTIGVQSSIRQQRYNDSVQSFAEFLRSVYSEVLNVQNLNTNGGRSERAIYGKVVTFGEQYNLSGENNNDNAIFVYSVIGKVDESSISGNALTQLRLLDANVIKVEKAGASGDVVNQAGMSWSYTPRWQAQIEPGCVNSSCNYDSFRGTILIARHPDSGIVNTYYASRVVEVNAAARNTSVSEAKEFQDLLIGGDNGFLAKQIDFCVNPDPGSNSTMRRNVRIVKDARNISGVEIIADDSEDNKCKGN